MARHTKILGRGKCLRCKQPGPLHPVPLYWLRYAPFVGMVDALSQCCRCCVAEIQAKHAGRRVIYTNV